MSIVHAFVDYDPASCRLILTDSEPAEKQAGNITAIVLWLK